MPEPHAIDLTDREKQIYIHALAHQATASTRNPNHVNAPFLVPVPPLPPAVACRLLELWRPILCSVFVASPPGWRQALEGLRGELRTHNLDLEKELVELVSRDSAGLAGVTGGLWGRLWGRLWDCGCAGKGRWTGWERQLEAVFGNGRLWEVRFSPRLRRLFCKWGEGRKAEICASRRFLDPTGEFIVPTPASWQSIRSSSSSATISHPSCIPFWARTWAPSRPGHLRLPETEGR